MSPAVQSGSVYVGSVNQSDVAHKHIAQPQAGRGRKRGTGDNAKRPSEFALAFTGVSKTGLAENVYEKT